MRDKFVIPGVSNGEILSASTKAFQELALFAGVKVVDIINTKKIAKSLNKNNNPYIGQPGLDNKGNKDRPIGQSYLGTPIYTDLTLMAGFTYTDMVTGQKVTLNNDRFSGTSGNGPQSNYQNNNLVSSGFYMNLETVIITINQPIKIIKTEIQGRPGTVKEYIGAGDAQITINAILTNEYGQPAVNGVYPRNEVNRLKAWLDAPVSKKVVASWLQNMGIDNIVVESYNFPQTQGGYSYQMVTINAISDMPVQFKITMPLQS